MDRKQPLVLVLIVLLFGVAIAMAIWAFSTHHITAHRDQILSDINFIASDAYQYRLRPSRIGGGGGSYLGYAIPSKVRTADVAHYDVVGIPARSGLEIEGVSEHGLGSVLARVDSEGHISQLHFTGKFE